MSKPRLGPPNAVNVIWHWPRWWVWWLKKWVSGGARRWVTGVGLVIGV